MAFHMYVDESKTPNYLLMGVLVPEAQVVDLRAAMRSLLLPGQERIHFKHESDARRKRVLDVVCDFDVRAGVAVAARREHESVQRRCCLRALAAEGIARAASRIVVEQDETHLRGDKQVLYEVTRELGTAATVSYAILRSWQDACLWVADAFAWTWSKGGRGQRELIDRALAWRIDA